MGFKKKDYPTVSNVASGAKEDGNSNGTIDFVIWRHGDHIESSCGPVLREGV
jgi:hypothetical protein